MIGVFSINDKLGKRLVIILKGLPCSWRRCSFCPFAMEQSSSIRDVILTNRRIIDNALRILKDEDYRRVAVFNGSSFHELPYDTIERLRDLSEGRIFEIESRSGYITMNSIRALLDFYKPEKLIIRIGFEVYDEVIRETLLNKGMPNTELLRIYRLRNKIKELELCVEFWVYLLFGIEYIPEEKVIESVKVFKNMFDGIIAIKYKRYLSSHPMEVPISKHLIRFLEENVDLVDWGGEQWIIKRRS